MKKLKIRRLLFLIIVLLGSAVLCSCKKEGKTRVDNDKAQEDKEGRYLTIINKTDQVLNEVSITVGEGTEIEEGHQKNPDETSFSVEIPSSYDEYTTFKVTFVDRYGLKYEKEVQNVPTSGRKEVVVTEDDYVKQKGDFWRKLERLLNGD